MSATIGYHIVISGYGLWLPGDSRGSWSEAWDEQLGFIEPHQLHSGDPVRKRMAEERQLNAAVRLTSAMLAVVAEAVGGCAAESDWSIAAAALGSTHSHLLLTYTPRDMDRTIKWVKDCATKAVHCRTAHQGPVWCKGKWCSFIFTSDAWRAAQRYIERHNERRGMGPRPYPFLP
jgi:REP-associated tyrosine transposase